MQGLVEESVRQYAEQVRDRTFPGAEQLYQPE
jgi:ketopantoate hydroxymethyltransferase